MKRLNQIFLFLCFISLSANAQFSTRPFQEKVKALQVHRAGWPLSYPVIYMGTAGEAVDINFDVLGQEYNDISYSVYHCNADWTLSDLSVNEYLDGFQQSFVDSYEYSSATNVAYVNYRLQLPNPDMQLLLSGNYAVVFTDDNSGDTLATACFSMVDAQVTIFGNVGGIANAGRSKKMQQVNFTIDYSSYTIQQPISESKVIVKQNNSPLRQAQTSTPTYIHPNQLIFDQHQDMAFPGGDEYRTFETSSLKFAAEGVEEIAYFKPYYHITLRPDECRSYRAYEYDDDINGRFLIRRQESDREDYASEADYLVAHFFLPMDPPIYDGKVYVGGDFTYHQPTVDNQLTYNVERKAYEGHLLLKQGYYNYRYFVKSNRNQSINSSPIELDAYQTENDYVVYFYHRPMGERYDRLVGYQVINTLK